jgi:hypothetical protein
VQQFSVDFVNDGTATLSVQEVFTGDFQYASAFSPCGRGVTPSSIEPGRRCNLDIAFIPTGLGTRNGSVVITDNVGNSYSLALTGTGLGGGPGCGECPPLPPPSATPELDSLPLFSSGLAGLLVYITRRRKRKGSL